MWPPHSFDYKWGTVNEWGTGGNSSDPCSNIYRGSQAFSEVEIRNIRDWLNTHKKTVKAPVNYK